MSYKKKKLKKSRVNQLLYRGRLVIAALKKAVASLKKKEGRMMLPQTKTIMKALRMRARGLRKNNKKIDEWVDRYIDDCILSGKGIDILTQWCLSKDLEKRLEAQGGTFLPLDAEKKLFEESIPEIISIFQDQEVQITWWITFNGSFLERGRISDVVVGAYTSMIQALATSGPSILQNVTFLDWEKDVLNGRPTPNKEVLSRFMEIVPQRAFELDIKNLLERVKQYPDFTKTEKELREEAKLKIACEAEEGRFLMGDSSPFSGGQFILIPLEFPERYIFFALCAPGFEKKIAAVLKPYPWRLDGDTMRYEV